MNVYDKEVKIYNLDAGTPLQKRLRFVSRHLGREESVYAARYWDSVQDRKSTKWSLCRSVA